MKIDSDLKNSTDPKSKEILYQYFHNEQHSVLNKNDRQKINSKLKELSDLYEKGTKASISGDMKTQREVLSRSETLMEELFTLRNYSKEWHCVDSLRFDSFGGF